MQQINTAGSGVGLAIVKAAVEDQGGVVRLESRMGLVIKVYLYHTQRIKRLSSIILAGN